MQFFYENSGKFVADAAYGITNESYVCNWSKKKRAEYNVSCSDNGLPIPAELRDEFENVDNVKQLEYWFVLTGFVAALNEVYVLLVNRRTSNEWEV